MARKKMTVLIGLAALTVAAAGAASSYTWQAVVFAKADAKMAVPQYEVDTSWPPKLPNDWIWGVPTWVTVDRHNHIWVLHRPRTAPAEQRAKAAPAVVEFDNSGKFLQAWGGPGEGFDWPDTEHGIFVDHKDNVWITGINPRAGGDVSRRSDDMILKFTNKGKFIKQIGGRDVAKGNLDTANPKQSAEVFVYSKTNEAFIADGYGNQRMFVIDADTLGYKRMWAAFGKAPIHIPPPPPAPARGAPPAGGAADGRGAAAGGPPQSDIQARMADVEGPGPDQFGIVHGAKVSNDGFVYVADRGNRRIQVFTPDGKYLKQGFVNRTTSNSSCDTVGFSPDKEQTFIFCPDFNKGTIAIVNRQSLETVGEFAGRGAAPGQLQNIHALAVDSKWNVYSAEVAPGRRLQKYVRKDAKK
jgi:hypothetical protein